MGNNYTVKPNWKGKQTVSYECGHCHAPLESPLEDAGDTFPCPTCGGSVQTPGGDELRKHRLAKEQQRIESAKRNEAVRALDEIAEAQQAAELKAQTAREQAVSHLSARMPARHVSLLAFALTLLLVVALYFAAVWPLQNRLSATQTKQVEPTMADFKSFGDKFAVAWAGGISKKISGDFEEACTVTGIDKRKTDSILHPVVWVLLVNESFTHDKPDYIYYSDSSIAFCFTWDGTRWCGVESTTKQVTLISSDHRQPDNIEHVLSAKDVDDVALKCQFP